MSLPARRRSCSARNVVVGPLLCARSYPGLPLISPAAPGAKYLRAPRSGRSVQAEALRPPTVVARMSRPPPGAESAGVRTARRCARNPSDPLHGPGRRLGSGRGGWPLGGSPRSHLSKQPPSYWIKPRVIGRNVWAASPAFGQSRGAPANHSVRSSQSIPGHPVPSLQRAEGSPFHSMPFSGDDPASAA